MPILHSPATPSIGSAMIPPNRNELFGDRFTEQALLGSGAFTHVYRCFDNDRKHWVVLKQLNPITARRAEDRERFLRESKWMELIDHPTVPRVYDRFRSQEPAPYFSMELVEGRDLCGILHQLQSDTDATETGLSLDNLIATLIQASEGLEAAHKQGVLHRDIKPENIMLTRDGTVKIIDWGVAKPIHSDLVQKVSSEDWSAYDRRRRERLTAIGHCPGTMMYMSPEQAVGLCELDVRTDVYSLGAVLFDCLALCPYIDPAEPADMLVQITQGPHRTPSERTKRGEVPARLESVCMKALAADRRQRYESMQAFRDALSEAL